MNDGEWVRKLADEGVNTVPACQFAIPALLLNLGQLTCKLKILNQICVEAKSHLSCLLWLNQELFILSKRLLLHTSRVSEVIGILEGLQESLTLLKNVCGKLRHGMIVRLVSEVVLRKSIDIFKMRLLLELVVANTLKVEVHHRAVLVAKLIHDVMIFLLLFVDKDRLQGSLWLLLEYFYDILWFKLMRALRLYCVLEGSHGLKA